MSPQQLQLKAGTVYASSSDSGDDFAVKQPFGVDRREAMRKSKQAASIRIAPPSGKLPPGVLEMPSASFRYISKRHLCDEADLPPDFDITESSDGSSCCGQEDDVPYEQIQVADGVFMRLRGSQETQEAWDKGKCINTVCFVCDTRLACVSDCDCVVCPVCRLVSPVDYVPPAAGFRQRHVGGVGLGIML